MDECVAVAVAEAVAVAVTEAVAEADQSIHDQSIHDPSISRTRCNPDFARILRVAEQHMKKLICGAMNRAENLTCLHSKVLRRGWQGSGYLIDLRMRRSGSEKRNLEFLGKSRKIVRNGRHPTILSNSLTENDARRVRNVMEPLQTPKKPMNKYNFLYGPLGAQGAQVI